MLTVLKHSASVDNVRFCKANRSGDNCHCKVTLLPQISRGRAPRCAPERGGSTRGGQEAGLEGAVAATFTVVSVGRKEQGRVT